NWTDKLDSASAKSMIKDMKAALEERDHPQQPGAKWQQRIETRDLGTTRQVQKLVKDDIAPNKLHKQARKNMADTTEMPDEKFSAQFMRRAHEDHVHLLQESHQYVQQCEDQSTVKLIESVLQDMEARMTAIERVFAQRHPDYEPLAGAFEEQEETPQ